MERVLLFLWVPLQCRKSLNRIKPLYKQSTILELQMSLKIAQRLQIIKIFLKRYLIQIWLYVSDFNKFVSLYSTLIYSFFPALYPFIPLPCTFHTKLRNLVYSSIQNGHHYVNTETCGFVVK